jgi:hypothetical protein
MHSRAKAENRDHRRTFWWSRVGARTSGCRLVTLEEALRGHKEMSEHFSFELA